MKKTTFPSCECGDLSRDCRDLSRECEELSRDCEDLSRGCGDLSRDCGMKGLLLLTNTDFNHVFYTPRYSGNNRKSSV